MNNTNLRRSFCALVAVVALALGARVASAEVNKAVTIEEWYVHETSTCQGFHLSQLASRESCRDYQVKASVKVRNITSTATGEGLVISLKTDRGTICGSVKISKKLYANAYQWFDVVCHTRSEYGTSGTPYQLEALVHQSGNLSNGVSGGVRESPWCVSWLPDAFAGACGTY